MFNIERLIIIIMMFMNSFPTATDFTRLFINIPLRSFVCIANHTPMFRSLTHRFFHGNTQAFSKASRLITGDSIFPRSNKRLITNSANQCNVRPLIPLVISLHGLCASWSLAVGTLSTFTTAILAAVVKRFKPFTTFNTFNFHADIISHTIT